MKTKMRVLLCALLVLIQVLVVVGCGGGGSSTDDTTDKIPPQTTLPDTDKAPGTSENDTTDITPPQTTLPDTDEVTPGTSENNTTDITPPQTTLPGTDEAPGTSENVTPGEPVKYDHVRIGRAFTHGATSVPGAVLKTPLSQPGNGWAFFRVAGNANFANPTPLPDLAEGLSAGESAYSAHIIDIGAVQTVNGFVYGVTKGTTDVDADGVWTHYGMTEATAGRVTYWYSIDGVNFTKLENVEIQAIQDEYYEYYPTGGDNIKYGIDFQASFDAVETQYMMIVSERTTAETTTMLELARKQDNFYLLYEE